MLTRRGLLAGAALAALASPARADLYPARPVTILSGNGPGSTLTISVRVVADAFAAYRGSHVVVEPRPGAFGFVAARAAMEAAPDGYTLVTLTAGSMHAIQSHGYDPLRDLEYVTSVAELTLLLLTSTAQAENVGALVARARRATDVGAPILYGYSNTVGKLAAERFVQAAGIEAIGVPYTGREEMMLTHLGTNQFAFAFVPASSARGQIEGGALRVLAVARRARSIFLPSTPTIVEAGVSNFRMRASVVALAGPRGMPDNVPRFWRESMRRILDDERVVKLFANTWTEPLVLGQDEFLEYVSD